MLIKNVLIRALVQNLQLSVVHVTGQWIGIAEGRELPQTADSDHLIDAVCVVILRGVLSVEVCWSFASLRRVAQIVTALRVIGIPILELKGVRS